MTEEQADLQKLKKQIEIVLKNDDLLWDEEGNLNQIRLIELAAKHDETIISLLYSDESLRQKFFLKIKDTFIFKTNAFQFFMEGNKINNSFTAYKNHIGLTDGKKFIKDTNDVVLNFPYKDCVLEGGQSNEEGSDTYFESQSGEYEEEEGKRKEIFYNETIAHDEIDRLLDTKAFINWKRYNKDGEHKVEKINRHVDGTINENMIIKGNNLLALHSLKEQFAGKIKLIYIDPPFNTGGDGFQYNDNFKHSTWLIFMKNRLEIAKELLRDDGAIFVHCDDNEQAYLKVLMDDVFGEHNFIANAVWNSSNSVLKGTFTIRKDHEYILCYGVTRELTFHRLRNNMKFENPDNDPNGPWFSSNAAAPSDNGKNRFEIKLPNGKTCTRNWKFTEEEYKDQKVPLYLKNGNVPRLKLYKKNCNVFTSIQSSIFTSDFGTTTTGRYELKALGFRKGSFSTPKPEKLMSRIIEMTTRENDIVLDYHLGSGTTCAVAHKMGRQYIGIEQMDYIEDIAIKRMNKVIAGEQGGISKLVNWQSGGEFIYCELAKWNEQAKEEIQACKELKQLEALWSELCDKYFLHYNVKIKEFKEKVIGEEEFRSLALERQKEIFSAMLDNNQLYVHYSEMEDTRFNISASDQSLTNEFYKDG